MNLTKVPVNQIISIEIVIAKTMKDNAILKMLTKLRSERCPSLKNAIWGNAFFCVCCICSAGSFTGSLVSAQSAGTEQQLDRSGLRSIWFNTIGIGSGGKIVDWHLNVKQGHSTSFVRIEAGTYTETLSENDLNAFGEPWGLDGLVEQAELRREILEAQLSRRGQSIPVKVDQYSLPKSSIYILGSNNVLTSLDADSGKQNWSVTFGSTRLPSIGVGSSDNHVAAVNGSRVYCFDAITGKELWSHACRNAVVNSPVVASNKIFVPLIDGRMEAFQIDNEGVDSYVIFGTGKPTARPLLTENTISWPTTAGHLNVAPIEGRYEKYMLYRLKAFGGIASSAASDGKRLYATSRRGFVYAIDENAGRLEWQTPLGVEISQSPYLLGEYVYIITDDGRMYKLDAKSGGFVWDRPVRGVGRFIGASQNRLYVTDRGRSMLTLEPNTGAVLSSVEGAEVQFVLANKATDRLYVASSLGLVRCIHEIGRPVPYFHSSRFDNFAAKLLTPKQKSSDAEAEEIPNPFMDSTDPKNQATPTNPFDSNPFDTTPADSNPLATDPPSETNPPAGTESNPDSNPFETGNSGTGDSPPPGSRPNSGKNDLDPFG